MDLTLDYESSKALLSEALVSADVFHGKIESVGTPAILSVWKPSDRFHIADVLVARTLAAAGVVGADCCIFLSSYLGGQDPQQSLQAQRNSRLSKNVLSDMFDSFSDSESITIRQLVPATIADGHIREKVSQAYGTACQAIETDDPELFKTMQRKGWALEARYAIPLVALIAQEEPHLLLSGKKHAWIWQKLVPRVLAEAGLEPPEVLFLNDIPGLSTRVLDDADKDCLYVDLAHREILGYLGRIPAAELRANQCLKTILGWLCFPSGVSASHNGSTMSTLEEWEAQDPPHAQRRAAAANALSEVMSGFRDMIRGYGMMIQPPAPTKLTNVAAIDVVERTLNFSEDHFDAHGIDESPDERPDLYRTMYLEATHEIFSRVVHPVFDGGEYKDLVHLLDSCEGIDRLQTVFSKWHRDHSAHQFNVFGLGLLLLRSFTSDKRRLEDRFAEIIGISVQQVECAWALAALFHDHAYPLGYLLELQPRMTALGVDNKTAKQLGSLNRALIKCAPDAYDKQLWPTDKEFEVNVRTSVNAAAAAIDVKIPMDVETIFADGSLYTDHGVLAATNVWLKNGEASKEQIDPVLCVALRAVAHHNMGRRLSFDDDPLSGLLALCDELHEWGRPLLVGGGEFVCPVVGVCLNLQPRTAEGYDLPKHLEVEFLCAEGSELERAGWREEIFQASKEKAISNLRLFAGDAKPKDIVLCVRAPSRRLCDPD